MATHETKIILAAEDRTTAAFASAKRGLDGFAGGLSKAQGLMAGFGVGVSVAGLAAFVKTSIDAADAVSKLSVKTGIAVEDLAGWQHVMDLSGATTEQFEMAVGKLNTTIAEHPEKLQKLGITARDANGALLQMADAFQRIDDPTRRAAIAAEYFGERVGRDMVVALSSGRQAVEALIRQGKELNPITTEMAQQAEKFNDALDVMKKRAGGVGVVMANQLLPHMNAMLERWERAIALSQKGYGFFELIFGGINPTGNTVDQLKSVNDQLYAVNIQLKDIVDNPVQAVIAGLDEKDLRAKKAYLEGLKKQLISFQRDAAQAAASAASTKIGPLIDTKGYFGTDKKAKSSQQISDLQWAIEESAHLQKTWTEIYAQIDEDSSAAFEDATRAAEEWEAGNERANDALAAMRQEMLAIIDPIQQYRDKLEEVDLLVSKGLLTPEQATAARFYWQEQIDGAAGFGQELTKVTDDFQKKLQENFQQGLEDFLFDPFQEGLDGMLAGFGRMLQRMVAEAIAADISRAIFGGGSSSDQNILGSIASIFGFANGGIMTAGGPLALSRYASGGIASSPQLALFGEGSRPEAFVPLPDGRRIPVAMQGGGGGTVIHVNIQATDLGSFQRSEGQISATLARAVSSARRFQ